MAAIISKYIIPIYYIKKKSVLHESAGDMFRFSISIKLLLGHSVNSHHFCHMCLFMFRQMFNPDRHGQSIAISMAIAKKKKQNILLYTMIGPIFTETNTEQEAIRRPGLTSLRIYLFISHAYKIYIF